MKYIKESVNLMQIPFFDRKTVCMWYNKIYRKDNGE